MSELTPMMQQYMKTKEDYPDCILFYRLGDFYEMFFDDAVKVSKELELTLTLSPPCYLCGRLLWNLATQIQLGQLCRIDRLFDQIR